METTFQHMWKMKYKDIYNNYVDVVFKEFLM